MARAIVDTTAGTVRGTIEAGVRRFRGVPYAAAPVGDRRFAAPAPARASAVEASPRTTTANTYFLVIDSSCGPDE